MKYLMGRKIKMNPVFDFNKNDNKLSDVYDYIHVVYNKYNKFNNIEPPVEGYQCHDDIFSKGFIYLQWQAIKQLMKIKLDRNWALLNIRHEDKFIKYFCEKRIQEG